MGEKDNDSLLIAFGRIEGVVSGMKDTFTSELRAIRGVQDNLSRQMYAEIKILREKQESQQRRIEEQGKNISSNYAEFDRFRTKLSTSFTILMFFGGTIGGVISTLGYKLLERFIF